MSYHINILMKKCLKLIIKTLAANLKQSPNHASEIAFYVRFWASGDHGKQVKILRYEQDKTFNG